MIEGLISKLVPCQLALQLALRVAAHREDRKGRELRLGIVSFPAPFLSELDRF